MPLTPFQSAILAELAKAPTPDRYLAGGAAMHFTPNSLRYSDEIDFFHDTEGRVASAFAADRDRLVAAGYEVGVELSQPGLVRAMVVKSGDATRIDWAHDSAWRFLPLVRDTLGGWLLAPIDLAINKLLALAGRDEARDFVDIIYVEREVLPLGALVWATVGKDPGFSPLALLELLKRRGHPRPEEIARLQMARPFDLIVAKETWLSALDAADGFIRSRPPEELGCLYYSDREKRFVAPTFEGTLVEQGLVAHFGAPGGVIPRVVGG